MNEINTLQKVLQQDPSNFQARRELSILLLNQGFNEEAEGNLKYLHKYFPQDDELLYNLGIVSEKLKKNVDARDYYQKAIEINPQSDYIYNLGEVLVSLSDWENAIQSFTQVLETDTNDANSYYYLGFCNLKARK